jgi:hypothetical protein
MYLRLGVTKRLAAPLHAVSERAHFGECIAAPVG